MNNSNIVNIFALLQADTSVSPMFKKALPQPVKKPQPQPKKEGQ